MDYVTLSNGVRMPRLGYGVYQVKPEECERCVLDALDVGYRSIDTAQAYRNEEQVGNAIKKSGVPRGEIFLTTKVWMEHFGEEEARKSILVSMDKLQTEYIDLVLLHSLSGTHTAHGALWKNSMRTAGSAPLAFRISIRTEWSNFAGSTVSVRW